MDVKTNVGSGSSVRRRSPRALARAEMLGFRPAFNPASIFLVEDFDRLVRNHLARAAYRTVDGPHGACTHRLGNKLNLQLCGTPLTSTRDQDVAFQLNLRGGILAPL